MFVSSAFKQFIIINKETCFIFMLWTIVFLKFLGHRVSCCKWFCESKWVSFFSEGKNLLHRRLCVVTC